MRALFLYLYVELLLSVAIFSVTGRIEILP